MPLIGYIKTCECPATFLHPRGIDGQPVDCVPLRHYAFDCPNPPMPNILARALYSDIVDDRYRGVEGPIISPSKLTRCPLQTYLEATRPYVEYAVDPGGTNNDRRFMLRGTFAHKGLLDRLRDDPEYIVEQPYQMDLGFPFYFKPDAYRYPRRKLYDLKTQSLHAVEKKGKMADADLLTDKYVKDNVRQVNMYRWGLTQLGLPVDEIELQYWDGDLRVRRLTVPLEDLDRVGNYVRRTGAFMWDVLNGHVPVDDIPFIPVPPKARFSPQKASGIWYAWRDIVGRREIPVAA